MSSTDLPSRPELLEQWTRHVGGPPPTALSNQRLWRGIRYAQQVAADPKLVELERQLNQRLRQLARKSPSPSASILPGTRLLREWGGTTHEVTVTDQGFRYRGTVYRSLSAIAATITGTRWSGPKFFGIG